MCRWLAYNGPAIRIGELLFQPDNSIVRQSMEAHEGATPVNGDGFGLGWFDGTDPIPCRYRSVRPAWNDVNLRDVTRNLHSPAFVAHVRASTGGAVEASNCHPFQHGRWLFCHNGEVTGFDTIRRTLMLALEPACYDEVEGSTDSEVLFALAIGFGLHDDPHGALERAIGFVEQTLREHGDDDPCIQMTIGMTDGDSMHVARYATHGTPRTLYHSTDVSTLREVCPDHPDLQELTVDEVHLVVSEPLDDLPGSWVEVEPSTFVTMEGGHTTTAAFTPRASST